MKIKSLMQCIYFLSHILEQPKCSPGKASPFPVSQLPRVRASTPVVSAQGGACCACGLCALSPDSPTWGAPGCWSTPARPPSTALQPSLPFQKQSLLCPGAKRPGWAGASCPQGQCVGLGLEATSYCTDCPFASRTSQGQGSIPHLPPSPAALTPTDAGRYREKTIPELFLSPLIKEKHSFSNLKNKTFHNHLPHSAIAITLSNIMLKSYICIVLPSSLKFSVT